MADNIGKDFVLTDLLLLTLSGAPLSVIFAGVEGDENVGLPEEDDDAGACTVICKHLKVRNIAMLDQEYR